MGDALVESVKPLIDLEGDAGIRGAHGLDFLLVRVAALAMPA